MTEGINSRATTRPVAGRDTTRRATGAFSSLVAATLVFSRRFAATGERGWAAFSLASGLGALVLSGWPSTDGASIRYAIAAAIAWAWLTLLANRLRGEQPA